MNHRVVIDTNVYISASFNKTSITGQFVDNIFNSSFVVVHSFETFNELETRLRNRKFNKYVHPIFRQVFIKRVKEESTFIQVDENISVCRDVDDNKFLELSVTGNASFLVTGDKDLLVLKKYRGTTILTPRDFSDKVL